MVPNRPAIATGSTRHRRGGSRGLEQETVAWPLGHDDFLPGGDARWGTIARAFPGFSPCITAGKPPVSYPGIRVVAFAGTRSPHFARPATGWRQHPAVDARTRSAPQCHSPVNKLRDRLIHGGTRIRLLIIFSRNTHRTVLRRPAGRGPSN